MTDVLTRLRALPTRIKVGVIGIGNIGKGLVYQVGITPGMECVAIADINLPSAIAWAQRLGRDFAVVETLDRMCDAIRAGKLAVCADGLLVSACPYVDVLLDSTSAIAGGLNFASTAIAHHKHVVMMNSEADLVFGPHLASLAFKEDVVYTSADGDQHTVMKRLINEIEFWGFRTVMAGNMKGFLNRYVTPDSIAPEADKRFMDHQMCSSYSDGTKMNIENALLANAIGARVTIPGMLGPKVRDIYDAFEFFDLDSMWDVNTPLVDYTLGSYPPGGVFVIGFNDQPHQVETLSWYPPRLGKAPFYLFHRPYHLGHIEAMACIAEAFLDHWPVLSPKYGFMTNVYAYAKRDLHQGEILDGIGGFCAYGLIENVDQYSLNPGLPICLADHVTLRRDIPRDEKILMTDVVIDSNDIRFRVFQSQLDFEE